MIDSVTTTTSTGWFSRIKGAFFGVLIGLMMIPGSVILLSWNEYRTIHRTQGLKQGANVVESIVDPANLEAGLEGQLVHLSGFAHTDDVLRDNDFNFETSAVKLSRDVEMYQWDETKRSKTKKKVGGGTTTRTTYEYDRKWKSGYNNSSSFHEKAGHENPKPKFKNSSHVAKHVTVGAYELNNTLKGDMNSFETLSWTDEMFQALPQEVADNGILDGEYLYWSKDGPPSVDDPRVGDQRIQFRVVSPADVTLVAAQKGNSFSPFTVPNGEKIEQLYVGQFTAEEMFEKFQQENITLAWILRLVGFLVCCAGFYLLVAPLGVFADVIPFLGSMTRGIVGFFAFLSGSCVALGTIAVAWIAVRPLIGIPLLIVSIAALVMLFRLIWNQKKTSPPKTDPDEIPYVPMA